MIHSEIEILLIEDNPHDAELTIRSLKKKNLANKIFHLPDGAAALDFLFATGEFENRNQNNLPKVILLDLNMPKVSGHEVLQTLKKNDLTKMIPVVVLTSSKEDPEIEKCYALGANSYIIKPVGFDNFLQTVFDLGFYWMLHNQAPNS